MRDPAYIVILVIIAILMLDYFLLGGYLIHFFGKMVVNLADRISGWIS